MALQNGCDITVELEDYHSSTNRFPASNEHSENHGIVLRAFHRDDEDEEGVF